MSQSPAQSLSNHQLIPDIVNDDQLETDTTLGHFNSDQQTVPPT